MHNYAVDMIRILAMYGIVCIHYLAHGGFLLHTAVLSTNWMLSWFLYSFVQISVNVFVIISGYFLVKRNNFSWRKVFKIWLEVAFYSVTISLLFYSNGQATFKDVLISFMPIKFTAYWFVPVYIALYILSPYLSKLGNALSLQEYRKFLSILIGLFSIYSFYTEPFGKVGGNITGITWFVVLFFIGGYIARFSPLADMKSTRLGVLYLFGVIVLFAIHCSINFITPDFATKLGERLYYINSPLVLFNSIMFFLLALRFDYKSGKIRSIIKNVSSLSFAVYLLHENSHISGMIWRDVFLTETYWESNGFLLNFIFSTLSVYIVCTFIEFARKKILFPLIVNGYCSIKIYWNKYGNC